MAAQFPSEDPFAQENIQRAAQMIEEDFVLPLMSPTVGLRVGALENLSKKVGHYERVVRAVILLLKTTADKNVSLADLNVDRRRMVRRLTEGVTAVREYHSFISGEPSMTTPSDVSQAKATLDDMSAILGVVSAGGSDGEFFQAIQGLPLQSQLRYSLEANGGMFL